MKDRQANEIDRLSIRKRPEGSPIVHQSWGKLLFMHWRIPVASLRPLIPRRLEIDTFEGDAWIGVVPFTIWDSRPVFMPPLPWVSDFHELNVRTYVHLDGVPGVYFFSLDAHSTVAVLAARTFFRLPYYAARIDLEQRGKKIIYSSSREVEPKPADFDATWTIGDPLPESEPGSLAFFLTERYCLYTAAGRAEESIYRCRIFHPHWPLQEAGLSSYHSTMIEVTGLPTPAGDPLLHYAESLSVEIWPLEEMS